MRGQLKKLFLLCIASLLASGIAAANPIETIVFIRHAEKSTQDLGQLNCQGLNRSLKIPNYLQQHFPKPDFIFAPDPAVKNLGYSYVRPLATIEPTAIQLNMPVNTEIGYNQPDQLMQTLLQMQYHPAVIYVAWEHVNILKVANLLFSQFDVLAPANLQWDANNYDQVFVFTIDWGKKPTALRFDETTEGLNHMAMECPQ